MRILLEPITGDACLAAVRAWCELPDEVAGRVRRLKSRTYLVVSHGGKFDGHWRVVRRASEPVARACFERRRDQARRGAVCLVALPWEFDPGQFGGDSEVVAMWIANQRRMQIVDSWIYQTRSERRHSVPGQSL